MNKTLDYILQKFKPQIAPRGSSLITGINRTIMAETLNELGFKEGAEVGVAEGYHAKVLFDKIPGLKLHCVDIWEQYPGYNEYKNIDAVYEEAKERLKGHNANIIKKFSMDATKDFADQSLDFVYIDAAHDFKSVANDIVEWSKKVKIGGIVFGHDFKHSSMRSRHRTYVKDVVPGYTYGHLITPWFELANDLRDPTFGGDNPGWMFVRMEGQLV